MSYDFCRPIEAPLGLQTLRLSHGFEHHGGGCVTPLRLSLFAGSRSAPKYRKSKAVGLPICGLAVRLAPPS